MAGPPDALEFRTAISHLPTGVTVVTSTGPAGPAGLTASAVCSLSLDPVLMLACIDLGSRTLRAVRHSGLVGVNVLAHDQQALALRFASKDHETDKFKGVGWREVDGVPVLDGVVAWLTGEVRELLPGGDHVIGVAGVTSADAPGGEPLVHQHGLYRSLDG